MIETGKVLQQRYRIDKQIGQGGMGAVYVATDERFGSTVAIKETLCMDDNFRKAIEREARLLNSLKHSALPRVSDHFEEDNGQFLVMEYIPGDDVGSMIESGQNAFSVEQVMKWADQLLDALDYLHNQNIPVIHRDIKPQNLKITPRGDMILLDFGLAKGNPTDASHQTAAKSIFGYSRNYASLEQIQGTGTDPRSDLYSLAATLYHLLTNVAPEDALTRAMAVLSQKPDPLTPANNVNPNIPRGVTGVLQKTLALNADERPRSASEMRQMLSESENYAYLADAVTVSAPASDSLLFAHPTKLMPDATQADSVKQTDIKTEILPANLSELTSVGAAGAGEQTNVAAANYTAPLVQKRRGFGVAAGALGLLLAGGLIAGGIYAVKPSVFGLGQKEVDKTTETGTTAPITNDANTSANPNVNSIQSGSAASAGAANSDVPAKTEPLRQANTVDKPGETTKNNKQNGGTRIQSDGTEIQIPPDGRSDNMVVTERNNNGTSTFDFRNGRQPLNVRRSPDGTKTFPNGFDPSNLTPAQRRRLKTVMRNGGQPPSPPKPTPY